VDLTWSGKQGTRSASRFTLPASFSKTDPGRHSYCGHVFELYYQSGKCHESPGAFLEKGRPASTNLESAHLKIDIETKLNLI